MWKYVCAILTAGLCSQAFGEHSWTWTIGCPESGGASPTSTFTATTDTLFDGSGICQRLSSGFTRFDFTSNSHSINHTTLYGHYAGDLLLIPPLLVFETKPVAVLSPQCPVSDKSLNWIVSQWKISDDGPLDGLALMGQTTYDTATGLQLDSAYDVDGTQVLTGPVALAGSCANGLYVLTGTGDRAGTVYFSLNGTGYYTSATEKKFFFLPVYTISAAADLGSSTWAGYSFNSQDSTSTRNIRVTTDAAGTTWTIQAYSDVASQSLDGDFTDTITISATNSPANGMMRGTLTRTGTGAGSGSVACIMTKTIATRVVCAAEAPNDNTIPMTYIFAREGAQLIGQASGASAVASIGLNAPEGIFTDGTRLFVADTTNHRVLIWNSIPTSDQVTPDVVLGQPDLLSGTANLGGRSSQTMSSPRGIFYDGTRLFVADSGNHRVLIWNSLPTTNQTAADLVLGQSSLTTGQNNQGGRSAQTLSQPYAVYSNGTKVIVADQNNHRILIWNSIPSVNKQAADVVLGQADFASGGANNGGISAQTLASPRDVFVSGGKLIAADFTNHRVLIWNSIPTADQTAADVVLGQPDMASSTANNGGISSQTLNGPRGISSDGTKLYVAEQTNHRVLIWNSIPTVSQTAANVVLGQPDMASNTANNGGRSSQSLSSPRNVTVGASKLFVLDSSNHRLLSWNAVPTTDQAAANNVQGQPDMESGTANDPGVSASTLANPRDFYSDGTRLFVVDSNRNRVLIWNSLPTSNQSAADVVLGQPNMTSALANNGGVSASSLSNPQGVFFDGTRLYVGDTGNHRVLIWSSLPASNGQAADLVLGQPDMTSSTANNGGRSASSLRSPEGVVVTGTRLFVADRQNNRILIWDTIPVGNKEAADHQLGQANFTAGNANAGGIGDDTLSAPRRLHTDGTRLAVGDSGNSRVLIWNTLPTVDREPADVVVGQPDMTSNTDNNGGRSAQTLSGAYGVYFQGSKFYVADSDNNRVLIWNTIPTSNSAAADVVLGQPDMTSGTANNGGLTSQTLSAPRSVYSDGVKIYVSDSSNDRINAFDVP